MTDEQLERKIEFIVETLAQVAVNDQKHDMRLARLEQIARLFVGAGLRERRRRRDGDERLTNALAELAEAQASTEASIAHTDRKLDALIDIVRQRNGG